MSNENAAALPPRIDQEALARHIANRIFELGSEPGLPCQRIAFMCAREPGCHEREEGGLAIGPFVVEVVDAISEYFTTRSELLAQAEKLAEAMRKHNLTHLGQLQLR